MDNKHENPGAAAGGGGWDGHSGGRAAGAEALSLRGPGLRQGGLPPQRPAGSGGGPLRASKTAEQILASPGPWGSGAAATSHYPMDAEKAAIVSPGWSWNTTRRPDWASPFGRPAGAGLHRGKYRRDQRYAGGRRGGPHRRDHGQSGHPAVRPWACRAPRLLSSLDVLMRARCVVRWRAWRGAGLRGRRPGDCPVWPFPPAWATGPASRPVCPAGHAHNSCASGCSVVNIDNGFGAGYLASMINQMEGLKAD
jgi:hypothetical protein